MNALVFRLALLALVGLFVVQPRANAGGIVLPPNNATAVPVYETGFHPICGSGAFYACWTQPYGDRFCGCWLGGDRPACPAGYVFGCGRAPNSAQVCGCY